MVADGASTGPTILCPDRGIGTRPAGWARHTKTALVSVRRQAPFAAMTPPTRSETVAIMPDQVVPGMR